MHLESIVLKGFRNISDQSINLCPKFNLFVGPNAHGKTNLIESVYLLSTGGSFRTQELKDVIMEGKETADIRAVVGTKKGESELKIRIGGTAKEFYRDSKRTRPGAPGGFSAVLFAPEEVLLLRKPPSARRRYIDTLVSHVSPTHFMLVRKYSRVVAQRNRLLQDLGISTSKKKAELKPWDAQLVELGTKLVKARGEWCEKLNELIPKRYSAVAPHDGEAVLGYNPSCGRAAYEEGEKGISERMSMQLKEAGDDELERGITLVGPQRDDFEAMIGGRTVARFCSQGQHRTFVLAMKMAEIEFIERESGEQPALLMDDVASELDDVRNSLLFELVRNFSCQVFIAATSERDIRILPGEDVLTFDVISGRFETRKQRNGGVCAEMPS